MDFYHAQNRCFQALSRMVKWCFSRSNCYQDVSSTVSNIVSRHRGAGGKGSQQLNIPHKLQLNSCGAAACMRTCQLLSSCASCCLHVLLAPLAADGRHALGRLDGLAFALQQIGVKIVRVSVCVQEEERTIRCAMQGRHHGHAQLAKSGTQHLVC